MAAAVAGCDDSMGHVAVLHTQLVAGLLVAGAAALHTHTLHTHTLHAAADLSLQDCFAGTLQQDTVPHTCS